MPWTLNTLPSEVLGLIISGSNTSFVIVRLWKCGDRLLQSKLSSGSRSVDLKAAQAVRTKLPLFFGSLRCLTYLSISSRNVIIKDVRNWPTFMFSLPSSLETLCIESLDIASALCQYGPALAQFAPQTISTEYPRGCSHLIDMNTLLPRLHTLQLTHPSGQYFADPTIDPSNFPGLPSSLTHLTASFNLEYTEGGPNRYLFGLPRSLRELCGQINAVGHNVLANLIADFADAPPHLTSLDRLWERRHSSLEWLPKSITWFHGSYPTWSLDTARHISPQLQSIDATTIDAQSFLSASTDWIRALPSRLTALRVCIPEDSILDINLLPSCLRRLRIDSSSWDQLGGLSEDASKSVKSWPPLLDTLRLFAMSPKHINHLPHTLNTLELSFYGLSADDDRIAVDVSLFPPQLTHLKCGMPSRQSHNLTLSFSGRLPSTLQYLELQTPNYDGGLHYSTLNLLEPRQPSGAQSLPTNPPTTCLTFAKLHIYFFNCEWFGHLPRWLISVRIAKWTIPQATKDAGNVFEGLPSSLQHFSAGYAGISSEEPGPSQRLASIVPRLRELTVRSCFDFPSSFIRELPPTLETLEIKLVELLEEDAILLPPKLSQLILNNRCDWSDPKLAKHKPWRSRKPEEVSSELASSLSW